MKKIYLFGVLLLLVIVAACTASHDRVENIGFKSTQMSTEVEHLLSLLGEPAFFFDVNITGNEEKELVLSAEHYINGEKQDDPTMLSSMMTDETEVKLAIFQRKVANKCQWVSAILSDGGSSTLEQDPVTCQEESMKSTTSLQEADLIDMSIDDEIVIAAYHISDTIDESSVHISLSDHTSDIPNKGETYIIKAKVKKAS